jgi:Uma2 family endonuclease
MSTVAALPRPHATARQRRQFMTAEEFFEWADEDTQADLINGEVHMHSPVSLPHSRLVSFMDRLLGTYVEKHDLGEVHREGWAIRLSTRNVLMPDVAYYTTAQMKRFTETYTPAAPTLAIEVLSKSSLKRDTRDKFALYEEHGVEEYWVLDPLKLEHRFYMLRGGLFAEFGKDEPKIAARTVPGFFVKRGWLNPAALPRAEACLAEIEAAK